MGMPGLWVDNNKTAIIKAAYRRSDEETAIGRATFKIESRGEQIAWTKDRWFAVTGIALQQRDFAEGNIGIPQPAHLFRDNLADLDDFQFPFDMSDFVLTAVSLPPTIQKPLFVASG